MVLMLSTSWWLWPNLYSKTEGCSHKETLLRKVYCYKNVRHTTVHTSKKFQFNILIGYWTNSIFSNRIFFFVEMLSLCDRDRHKKNFVLTKVFHRGQWNCFDLLCRHIPFCKKNLRSVAHTEKYWRFFKRGHVLGRTLYCGSVMCNDKAWNVVIFSINANIHVFVHVDLHEIYL